MHVCPSKAVLSFVLIRIYKSLCNRRDEGTNRIMKTADDGLFICDLFKDAVSSSDHKASGYCNHVISKAILFFWRNSKTSTVEEADSKKTVCRPLYLTAALASVTVWMTYTHRHKQTITDSNGHKHSAGLFNWKAGRRPRSRNKITIFAWNYSEKKSNGCRHLKYVSCHLVHLPPSSCVSRNFIRPTVFIIKSWWPVQAWLYQTE
jgi:hypothetical protein